MPKTIIYLHGFKSSSDSSKAKVFDSLIKKHARKTQVIIPDIKDDIRDSYEQIELSKDQLNDKELLLKPNQEVTLSMYMDKPIDMQLPATINLLVTHSEPAVKGDSVNSNNKEVTCETGLTIQVPMFIDENDVIKVDTKTISYVTRV